MQDPTTIDTSNLLGGSGLDLGINTGLIGTIMTVMTIISIILTIVIVAYFIVNLVHRRKSETAMIEMAKDIKEIRRLLEKQAPDPQPTPPVDTPSQPDDRIRTIAAHDET